MDQGLAKSHAPALATITISGHGTTWGRAYLGRMIRRKTDAVTGTFHDDIPSGVFTRTWSRHRSTRGLPLSVASTRNRTTRNDSRFRRLPAGNVPEFL
jgi:hypothetical protein